jgi:hypothetical protein
MSSKYYKFLFACTFYFYRLYILQNYFKVGTKYFIVSNFKVSLIGLEIIIRLNLISNTLLKYCFSDSHLISLFMVIFMDQENDNVKAFGQ